MKLMLALLRCAVSSTYYILWLSKLHQDNIVFDQTTNNW